MTETPFYTILKGRGLVRVTGPDRRGFLQGLVSNDVNLLDTQACVYACLLTPQGKFLHDFFITEDGDALILECEGGDRTVELHTKLSVHKLRAKVDLTFAPEVAVYAISHPKLDLGSMTGMDPDFRQDAIVKDPRHEEMGYRSFTKPEGLPEKPFAEWDRKRILLTVPDGSRDMIPGDSTLIECNIDRLNGISWDKGCYMGQELTARMHYRALVKRRLQTVQLPYEGDVRSTCGDVGLALVKLK